jgi:hypothetical protein
MYSGCEICKAPLRISDGRIGTEIACGQCGTRYRVGESGLEPLVTEAVRALRAARNRKASLVWKNLLSAAHAPAFDDVGGRIDPGAPLAAPPPKRPESLAPVARAAEPERAEESVEPARVLARWPGRVWLPVATLALGAALAAIPTLALRDWRDAPATHVESAATPSRAVVVSKPKASAPSPGVEAARDGEPEIVASPEEAPATKSEPVLAPMAAPRAPAAERVAGAVIAREQAGDPYGVPAAPTPIAATPEAAAVDSAAAEGKADAPSAESIADAAAAPIPAPSASAPSAPSAAPASPPSLGDAIAHAVGGAPAASSAPVDPAAPEARRFDRGAAMAALGRSAAAAVSRCRARGEPGRGSVTVTFAPSGAAQSMAVSAPFAGTPMGDCIASRFQGVHVPAFSGDAITVRQSIAFE